MDEIVLLGNEEPVTPPAAPVAPPAAPPLRIVAYGGKKYRAGFTKHKGYGQSKTRRKMEKASRKQNRKR
jgi:hypothetical protein